MNELFRFLLTAPPEPCACETVDAWWPEQLRLALAFRAPVDAAVAAGFASDRLGFAFAAGYAAALRALVPGFGAEARTALCASEEGGAHPRSIRTALRRDERGGLLLAGHKRWVTLGACATELLVVASTGLDEAGKNRLRVVRVRADAPGVRVVPMPEAPFTPEIPHAELDLEDVAVAEASLLPGDGYDEYLKPFRTIEDLHVHASLLGYLLGVGRRATWPEAWLEQLVACIVVARALSSADPRVPETHIALAGLLSAARRLVQDATPYWASVDPTERERWLRDQRLLAVAEPARGARRAKAWETLRQASDSPGSSA